MEDLLLRARELGATYSLRYVGYKEGQWTMPVKLTPARIRRLQDYSITEVRLHFNDSQWMDDE